MCSEPNAGLPRVDRDSLAFLQYTSGSTSTPKGVMVAHDNLLVNLEMLRIGMGNTEQSASVGWVPLYHDMGLMMGVMQPLYLGTTSVLMAPAAFMQRPLTWLRTIHRYRAEVTSAPNFAFDLCVDRFRADHMEGVDLSCWKVALNAAEPLHADTIARFTETFARTASIRARCMPAMDWRKPRCWSPAAGVAKRHAPASSTARLCKKAKWLLQQGSTRKRWFPAGKPLPASTSPSSIRTRIAGWMPNRVGEVWVSGPNVTRGYWRNQPATAETCRAHIADEQRAIGCGPEIWASWTRTASCSSRDGSRISSSFAV